MVYQKHQSGLDGLIEEIYTEILRFLDDIFR